jgi:hypothetical protein
MPATYADFNGQAMPQTGSYGVRHTAEYLRLASVIYNHVRAHIASRSECLHVPRC